MFSECGAYRYILFIRWNESLPLVASIGLNPSIADEFLNDPTVARDMKRADMLGFGSLLKLNLFPYRATDPRAMKAAEDPYGAWRDPECILHSLDVYSPQMVIAAWGNHGSHLGRSDAFRAIAKEAGLVLYAYRVTDENEPSHNLYLPYSMKPEVYEYV